VLFAGNFAGTPFIADMDKTEMEITAKLLARANPPPVLHRYRCPTDRAFAEISQHRVYLASPDDLNDPFECRAPVSFDLALLRQQFIEEFAPSRGLSADEAANEFDASAGSLSQELPAGLTDMRQDSGLICLTAVPNSIRMWSYYAEAHKGICIGYSTKVHPFMVAMKVTYQNPDIPLDIVAALRDDPTQLAAHITLRKAAEWDFDEEYRIPIGQIGDRPRAVPYDASGIVEIRFGARMENGFRKKLLDVISGLPNRPRLIQMGCDVQRFVLTEEVISI
jgi:hypothetical protein